MQRGFVTCMYLWLYNPSPRSQDHTWKSHDLYEHPFGATMRPSFRSQDLDEGPNTMTWECGPNYTMTMKPTFPWWNAIETTLQVARLHFRDPTLLPENATSMKWRLCDLTRFATYLTSTKCNGNKIAGHKSCFRAPTLLPENTTSIKWRLCDPTRFITYLAFTKCDGNNIVGRKVAFQGSNISSRKWDLH